MNLHSISQPLTEVIRQKIIGNGPLSFRDFMEMSLYHPGTGYYTSENDKIGKCGDYYTSPYLTSVFGEMIAKQLEEMWQFLGSERFTIVEYGAGTGNLCRDILHKFKTSNPDLYSKIDYCIIEKSPAMKKKAQQIVCDKAKWFDSINEIGPIVGCVLTNEVLDNFSVHQVVMKNELMEVFVSYDAGTEEFSETLIPASEELKKYLAELKVSLPYGFRTEINLQATEWIQEISRHLEKGFVMTIDYGYSSGELYAERRSRGTLLCYCQHKINEFPLKNIGKQDITAHVNFSALNHWGTQHGLNFCGYTSQAHFLRSLGLTSHIRNNEEKNGPEKDTRNAQAEKLFFIHTLLMDMGNKFKVLVQQKGMPSSKSQPLLLSGFKFSQSSV